MILYAYLGSLFLFLGVSLCLLKGPYYYFLVFLYAYLGSLFLFLGDSGLSLLLFTYYPSDLINLSTLTDTSRSGWHGLLKHDFP